MAAASVRPAAIQYTPPNGDNLASERGLSAFNFGKKWTTSGLWLLPFGRGQHLLSAKQQGLSTRSSADGRWEGF